MIERDSNSTLPFYQARAATLLGFLDIEQTNADDASEDDDHCWLDDVEKSRRKNNHKEQHARHWFREFCVRQNPDEAWAAFRLFVACADRRCYLWMRLEIEIAPLSIAKRRFLALNDQSLSRHLKENEKKLKEVFLGCKVDPGLAPWLKT